MTVRLFITTLALLLGTWVAFRIAAADLYAGYGKKISVTCAYKQSRCPAFAAYSNANGLWPEQAAYWARLGWLALQQGDAAQGVQYFEVAQKLQPTWPYHYINALKIYASEHVFKGPELARLWTRLAETGITEAPILRDGSLLALENWYSMGTQERASASQILSAYARYDQSAAAELAQRSHASSLFCRVTRASSCSHD